jgi:hypothetical protein
LRSSMKTYSLTWRERFRAEYRFRHLPRPSPTTRSAACHKMAISPEESRETALRAFYVAVVVSLAIVNPAIAQPGDRAIGLLSLRRVEGPLCGLPPASEIALYAKPEPANPIGWIRAGRHPASDSDCYRAIINVRWRADDRVQVLPTEEYEEEEPLAAIVVEQRHRWFKVQVPGGAAWLQAAEGDKYFSLQQLLVKRSAYLTGAWDGTLAEDPGGPHRSAADPRQYIPVRFVDSRDVRGTLWLKIGLMSHTIYQSNEPPRVVATGWVLAHDPAGQAIVWFNSRD